MTITLDFESRSRFDLKKHGGRLYWEHPSTEALCCVLYDTDTGDVGLWTPGDPCPVSPDDELGAHNAMGFDRFAAQRLGWRTTKPWVDTSELARRAGLPGALDALGTRWLGIPKDKVASAFTKSLSRPSRAKARRGRLPELTAEVMTRVISYCASDVEIMAHGWEQLEPYLRQGVFAGWEGEVSRVDRIVNDRGVAFDRDLARRLLELDAAGSERTIVASARVLGWSPEQTRDVVSSPQQFAAHTGLDNARAETIDAVLAQEGFEDERVSALCSARRALATIARGKLEAGLARVSPDGRLRDSHRYYGAHTGRWSGRGMQLQNIPRPANRFGKWGDAEICRYVDGEAVPDIDGRPVAQGDPDGIMVALRACITAAPGNALAVCDFSGVEARALAWCAGDERALEVFRSGKSPYIAAASVIFGRPYESIAKGTDEYDIGKKAELGCGYGMGPTKFEANYRPSRVGVDAATVVDGWRKLHAPIVAYWKRLDAAFIAAIEGRTTRVAPFDFVPSDDGRDVAIFLPSGRPIIYNAVGVSHDGRWPDGRPKKSPYYVGTKSGREHVYGGKIAENVIQAMCRDLMADALVRSEDAGLCPVLDVHDEIVIEQPERHIAEAYAELHRIMTTLPEWAEGFPVGAAGHHGKRYRK